MRIYTEEIGGKESATNGTEHANGRKKEQNKYERSLSARILRSVEPRTFNFELGG